MLTFILYCTFSGWHGEPSIYWVHISDYRKGTFYEQYTLHILSEKILPNSETSKAEGPDPQSLDIYIDHRGKVR